VELFFNPARYLKLFEIIPGPATSQVLDLQYGEIFRKTAVVAKDTPAFIGNRIGILVFKVYSIWLKT
jgi:3-hydroxyacyl-CoA dehydrogenase